ncbi:hypothetical protein HN011_004174 [Eciton burchellii]|jgi:hypothetical protein|nr:hypothetical protein HN011_004174 [Eciton burchellii]
MARWSTVLSGVFLALSTVLSLGKLLMLAAGTGSSGELTEADQWLTEIDLPQYRSLFKKKGECRVGPSADPRDSFSIIEAALECGRECDWPERRVQTGWIISAAQSSRAWTIAREIHLRVHRD